MATGICIILQNYLGDVLISFKSFEWRLYNFKQLIPRTVSEGEEVFQLLLLAITSGVFVSAARTKTRQTVTLQIRGLKSCLCAEAGR